MDNLERTVTTHYHLIHLPIDDYIPFCEYFVIPYIMWFGYVAFGIAFTALHDKKNFTDCVRFIHRYDCGTTIMSIRFHRLST